MSEQKHTYSGDKIVSSPFHVVHVSDSGTLGVAISGTDREEDAKADAAERNKRAADYGLTCKYVVRPKELGAKTAPEIK